MASYTRRTVNAPISPAFQEPLTPRSRCIAGRNEEAMNSCEVQEAHILWVYHDQAGFFVGELGLVVTTIS
jgi:hypothetical protein